MRLALEYAMRTGYLQKLMRIPFSLFIENIWDEMEHVVITVNQYYGKPNHFLVRKWMISNVNQDQILPPHDEAIIPKEELFYNDELIVDDYRTLNYCFDDYEYVTQPENASIEWLEDEQKKYHTSLSNFFFSESHKRHRHELLWHHFASSVISNAYKTLSTLNLSEQQNIVAEIAPPIWSNWMLWRKSLLNFPTTVSPELIFESEYKRKIACNIKYQKMLEQNVCCTDDFFS
jgi:hypothetical protein